MPLVAAQCVVTAAQVSAAGAEVECTAMTDCESEGDFFCSSNSDDSADEDKRRCSKPRGLGSPKAFTKASCGGQQVRLAAAAVVVDGGVWLWIGDRMDV